jgi:hypothetical protein
MTRIRQIYADQIFICDTCPTTGGSATCPTTGGSVIYLEGNTDDPDTLRYRAGTDRTACPAFLRGIFLSATPVRLLRDPRSVFSGNTDDADQVDLHRFFNPRLSATSVSPVRPPADPRSVFIGNTNCFLSAIIRNIRVIRVLFLSGTQIVSYPRLSATSASSAFYFIVNTNFYQRLLLLFYLNKSE